MIYRGSSTLRIALRLQATSPLPTTLFITNAFDFQSLVSDPITSEKQRTQLIVHFKTKLKVNLNHDTCIDHVTGRCQNRMQGKEIYKHIIVL